MCRQREHKRMKPSQVRVNISNLHDRYIAGYANHNNQRSAGKADLAAAETGVLHG